MSAEMKGKRKKRKVYLVVLADRVLFRSSKEGDARAFQIGLAVPETAVIAARVLRHAVEGPAQPKAQPKPQFV